MSPGLLGNQRLPGNQPRITWVACLAICQISSILAGLWVVLQYVQSHIMKQPLVILLFPPLAMASLALVIPLLMFVSYQADFPGLNPANPVHFYAISKRCYTALGRNNLKVTEKDL